MKDASSCSCLVARHALSIRPLSRAASRLAAWRPFLTGVALGLVCLAAVGVAVRAAARPRAFDALLRANVKNGVVNYPGFQDNAAFRKYVEDLAKPAKLDSKAETLAYYINAYNALAIEGILEGLSPSSLLGRARYFKFKEWPLNGQTITLYDLEHKVIRPLGEPRIHFAIICASKSCPFLRSETLHGGAARRAARRAGAAIRQRPVPQPLRQGDQDREPVRDLQVVRRGFPRPAGSPQKYIARYVADAECRQGPRRATAYKVEWIDYDWNLNGTPPRR